ncbi:MAG: alkaline phosphatase [Desulfobacterales bacterium]|jgi:alkaline phosphatase
MIPLSVQIKASRLLALCLLHVLLLFGCGGEEKHPQNIMLFIGDGMGVAHITAGKIAAGTLHLERFPISGLVTTHSANRLVTESAAATTALATGKKTNNRAISVLPDGTPLKTLFEYARDIGKSIGVVVTSAVTHATPAAFMSHVDNRRKQADIAEQIVNSGVDVLIGGGWVYFVPASSVGSRRKDDKDLLAALESRMPVVLSIDKISAHSNGKKLAALLAPDRLPKAADRDFSLARLTRLAIHVLSKNPNGFVLMVEGSQIDWAAHDKDTSNIISEMLDFDDAIGAALDFAQQQGHTLIVATADHETGGFAVHDGSIQDQQVSATAFTTGGHTASMVPIFAYGPSSADFSGILDNARVGQMLIDCLLKRKKPPS